MRIGWLLSLTALAVAHGQTSAQPAAPATANPPANQSAASAPAPEAAGTYHAPENAPMPAQPTFQANVDREWLAPPAGAPADSGPGCAQPAGEEAGCGHKKERVWASAEYLLWWMTDNRFPAVIGSLPAAQAPNIADLPPGAITSLFDSSQAKFRESSGVRVTAGVWIDPDQYCGLEGSFFILERRTVNFNGATQGDPIIGGLFVDPTNGRETIIVPTDPSGATETAHASVSERLWGAEGNGRTRLAYFGDSPLDVLVGFRYLDLDDRLDIETATDFIGFGTRSRMDSFHTHNRFYGGQLGGSLDLREGRWSLFLQGKVAVGGNRESIDINGAEVETPLGGTPRTFPGGILAQTTNIGHFTHTQVIAVPELTVNLGFNVTRFLRAFVGYNVIYISDAVRPGNVIDTVNPANVRGLIVDMPNPVVRPTPSFHSTDLWVQGLNFGVEVRF
jgi:hypothetical protein